MLGDRLDIDLLDKIGFAVTCDDSDLDKEKPYLWRFYVLVDLYRHWDSFDLHQAKGMTIGSGGYAEGLRPYMEHMFKIINEPEAGELMPDVAARLKPIVEKLVADYQ